MTINPLFRRLVLLTAFLCTLVLTTHPSGVLQGASEPPTRDLNFVHDVLQKGPQDYYLPGQPSLLPAVESDAQQLQELPSWSAIASTSLRHNQPDIFLLYLIGGEMRLTSASSTQTDPSLNHGSSTIYFSSNQTGNAEIFAIDANLQNQRQLTAHPANEYNEHISPDGTKIVFQSTRTGNSDVFVMSSDGSNVIQLTSGSQYDGYPNWSPDGTKIVYVSGSQNSYDIWLMNSDGSNKQQITAGTVAIAPDWSPDGTRIAYANDSDRNGFFELWVMNANGSGQTQLRSAGNIAIDYWTPTWSPDSRWLGYSVTEWIYYQNRWYWTASYLHFLELASNFEQRRSEDDTMWEADWGHVDIRPPDMCRMLVLPQSSENEFLVQWEAYDAESGVKTFDVQTRLQGHPTWQNWVTNSSNTFQNFSGPVAGIIEFRCRACDLVGNCTQMDGAEIKTVEIDTVAPESRVSAAENYTSNPSIQLTFSGSDLGTGIETYDLYVKDGENGEWQEVQTNINVNPFTFEGELGHIYYFASQAKDELGNEEVWQPVADDFVVIYSTSLSGSVTDNRGNPAVAAPIQLSPDAVFTPTLELPSSYQFLLGENPTHTLTFQPAGYDPLPSTVLTTTSNITLNLALAPEDNLLSNSHFETGDTAGWNGSEFTADTTYHTGAYGVALTQELTETAALTQTVVLTNTLHEPTLSFWYHIPITLENRALIVSVQGVTDTVQVISTTAATSGWVHAWADVSALAGQTVTVNIKATAGAGSVYLDEITLSSWQTPQVTGVTPSYWLNTEPITITITGSNFVATPTVWIAGVQMTHTTWISSTELVVVVPAGVPAGRYFVEVQNPTGPINLSLEKVHIDDLSVYLPLIRR